MVFFAVGHGASLRGGEDLLDGVAAEEVAGAAAEGAMGPGEFGGAVGGEVREEATTRHKSSLFFFKSFNSRLREEAT